MPLQGLWKFNESDGDKSKDSSKNTNKARVGSNVSWTKHNKGYAVEFDGSSGIVQVLNDVDIEDIFDGGGTISAIIEPNSDGQNNEGRIVQKGDSSNGYKIFTADESSGSMKIKLEQAFDTQNGIWETSNRVINVGQVHIVTIVYNSGDPNDDPIIYVDGSEVNITETQAPSGSLKSDGGFDLHIGNREAEDRAFDGIIDEPRLYDDKKTADEAEILSDNIPQRIGENLVGFWNLYEKTGKDLVNDNDGTITGTKLSQEGIDGSLIFDGDDDKIKVNDTSVLQNIFDSGGSLSLRTRTITDGENNLGRMIDKDKWSLGVKDESSGDFRIEFTFEFSTTNGKWETSNRVLSSGSISHIAVKYDSDSDTNDPEIWVDGTKVNITETQAPSGTRTSDSGSDLFFGNNSADDRAYNGILEEIRLYDAKISENEILLLEDEPNVSVRINHIPKRDIIKTRTVSAELIKSKQVNTFQFAINKTPNKYVPQADDVVHFISDSKSYFGGKIIQPGGENLGGILEEGRFTCKSHAHTLDRQLVNRTFADESLKSIIKTILNNDTDGSFTMRKVPDATPKLKSVQFNYENPSQVFKTIHERIGWEWRVDPYKDIESFERAQGSQAAFNIDDSSGNYEWRTLNSQEKLENIKNSIIVRGGERKLDIAKADARDTFDADGTQNLFPLGYPYNFDQMTVELNGTEQSLGRDEVDDPANFQVLYNKSQDFIRFTTKPSAGDTVTVYGEAIIPILARATDDISVSRWGTFEDIIIDKTITTTEEAHDRAQEELNKYTGLKFEGQFKTKEPGLNVGDTLHLDSLKRDINVDVVINRIFVEMDTPNIPIFTVEVTETKSIEFTDIMIDLIKRDKKNIDISDEEKLQRLLTVDDEIISFVENTNVNVSSQPYVYGMAQYGLATYS
jgi:hypothetical protein